MFISSGEKVLACKTCLKSRQLEGTEICGTRILYKNKMIKHDRQENHAHVMHNTQKENNTNHQ